MYEFLQEPSSLKPSTPIIAHVNWDLMYVVESDGKSYLITNLFDDEGEEPLTKEDITVIVYGTRNYWKTLSLIEIREALFITHQGKTPWTKIYLP